MALRKPDRYSMLMLTLFTQARFRAQGEARLSMGP